MQKIRSMFTIGLALLGLSVTHAQPLDYFIRWDQLPITESYSSNSCGPYEGYVNITNPITGSVWWDIPESGIITAEDTAPSSYSANLRFLLSNGIITCANKTNWVKASWNHRVRLIAFLPELYATIPEVTNGIRIRFPRTQIVGAAFSEFLSTSPSQVWFEIEAPDTNMIYSLLYSQQIGSNANWINHTNFKGSHVLTNINVVAHMSTNRPHGFWRVQGTTNTPPSIGANVGTEDGLDTPILFPPLPPPCTNDCGSGPTPPGI